MGFLDKLFGKKKEVSPGGSTIYRYDSQENGQLQVPETEGVYLEEIEAHFDALFPGRESRVLHEIVSDRVHIDVHVMWPTEEQDFFVLYTTGMSDLPMTLPEDMPPELHKNYERGELYICLPGDWPLKPDAMPSEDAYWPIRTLKFIARFPHLYHTWLATGHSIPNGPDYAPLDDSVGFGAVLLLGGGTGPLGGLETRDGRRVNLYNLIPTYKEEVEYKLKYGMEALDKAFPEGFPMILDPQRPNCCADFQEVLD